MPQLPDTEYLASTAGFAVCSPATISGYLATPPYVNSVWAILAVEASPVQGNYSAPGAVTARAGNASATIPVPAGWWYRCVKLNPNEGWTIGMYWVPLAP